MREIIAVDVLPSVDAIELLGPGSAMTGARTYTLRGTVRVVLSSTLKIKRLDLKFSGVNRLFTGMFPELCREEQEGSVFVFGSGVVEMTVRAGRTTVQSATTLAAGVTDLPFTMEIEAGIPPSYNIEMASLEYALTAIVIPAAMLAKSDRFKKVVAVTRHLMPGVVGAEFSELRAQFGGRKEGVVQWQVDVPKVICVDQENATVFVKLDILAYHGRPREVTVVLEQLIDCRISCKDKPRPTPPTPTLSNKHITTISTTSRTLPCIAWPALGPTNITIPLSLPERLHPDMTSPLADLRHRLRITVAFVDSSKSDFIVVFPVTATTVPALPPALGPPRIEGEGNDGDGEAPEHVIVEFDIGALPTYQTVLQDPVMEYRLLPSVC
ncbi:hypothetical protein BC936DRAFT_139553 [Jimgerdemannia flammicorona]|uniref:Arrestin-like N-terminal domain-containing protein n=1 Tax=Jimgerdemannia flammicorona TaxID=994334 RepID=A0A433DMV1_9FUNG|nr:hypothetical protein BC936DRAFT_139553 [Jimgerdemannia flammicorona]